MNPQTEKFLRCLDPHAKGFVFQRVETDGNSSTLALGNEDIGRLIDEIIEDSKCNVFVTINEMKGTTRSEKNGDPKRIRAVFIDDDRNTGRIPDSEFPIAPNIVVNTSAKKYQYYWLTEAGPEHFAEWVRVQKGMIARYGTDPAIHDLVRVMRLPGSYHRKGEPQLVTAEFFVEQRYSWMDITKAFPPIDEQIKERAVPSQSFSIEEAKEFILNNEEYDERFHAATRGAAQGLANKNYTHEQIETEITGWLMKAPSKGSSQWNRRIAELDNDIKSAFQRIQSEKPRKKSLPELQLEKPEDFPWELVPEDLRVAAQEMARVIKVAPEATLVGLISAVMACMGKRIPIYEKPYMQMYASLGFLVVLPAGERKSAIVNMIMRTLFFPIKKRLIKEWKTEKAKARAVNKDVEKHLKALEKVEPEWGNTEYENHIAEVAKWELRRSDVREKKPVFQIDNATEEYLENQINDNGGEIWVASGEARSIINNIAGRYNKSGDTSEGAYLKGIANDPISRGRVTTGDSECEMSCLNLLMYAQPDAVYKLTDHGTLSASGLFGRILTIAPPSMVGSRLEEKDEAPFDSSKLAGIGAAMNKAIDITDVEIHLSPDAAEARRLYHNRIEKEMGRGGIFEGEAEIVNKMCTGAFKLASALHFINAKDSITSSQNEFIPKQTFVNASELFDWFMKQNLQMIRYRKEQSIVEVAHEILKHMCSAKSADVLSVHGWFTEGRFKNTFLGTTSKKLYFVDALNMLEEYGHIELKKGKKGYEFREVKS